MDMRFTWNTRKAVQNLKKHKVSFAEVLSVFLDRASFVFDDDEHSEHENREVLIGYSNQNRLLIVVFAERDDTVRIISARRANPKEKGRYEKKR